VCVRFLIKQTVNLRYILGDSEFFIIYTRACSRNIHKSDFRVKFLGYHVWIFIQQHVRQPFINYYYFLIKPTI